MKKVICFEGMCSLNYRDHSSSCFRLLQNFYCVVLSREKATLPKCTVVENVAVVVCSTTTEGYRLAVASRVLIPYASHVAKAYETIACTTGIVRSTTITILIPR
jgi:hypothetical protein